ncbi:MAG: hypothetical protein INQ03_24165 [Candidatus Heimdallarchaeota archaeon]|nr:hypothetical protein [Candidatus Heimdallarchaeota archaeon]
MRPYVIVVILLFSPLVTQAVDISPINIETYYFSNQVLINETRAIEILEVPHSPDYFRARMVFSSNESSTLFSIIEYKIRIHLYSSALSAVPFYSSELIAVETPDEVEVIAPIYLIPDAELIVKIEILRGFNFISILTIASIIDLITMPDTQYSRQVTTRTIEQEFHLNKSLLLGDVEQTAIFFPPDILPEFNPQYSNHSMQLRFPISIPFIAAPSTIRLSVGEYQYHQRIEEAGEYEFFLIVPIQAYYTILIGFQGTYADLIISDVGIDFIPDAPLTLSAEATNILVAICLLAPVTIIIRVHRLR